MTLEERLENVAVLGAGGKMGSGISWLLAREMTLLKLQPEHQQRSFTLTLMDVVPEALQGVQNYLRKQAGKYAMKHPENLGKFYKGVDSPEELASQFTNDLIAILHPVTKVEEVGNAHLIFEAIIENIDIKVNVFQALKKVSAPDAFFFSNTSSIPIHELDERAGLNGHIIGFHFYNPPAVQKLVELITPEKIHPELPGLSRELAQRLGKIVIPANDIAGFIGNGHFTRDGLYGISQALRLTGEMEFAEAIYTMNRVTQDFLIRPMGIFQLIDYVGLDVFQSILNIMNPYFPDEELHSDLIDELVNMGIQGGQYPDGSQKDGFLKYEQGKIVGIYDKEQGQYRILNQGAWREQVDAKIGPLPEGHASWKSLLQSPQRETLLATYFSNLHKCDTPGCQLAIAYLKRSKEIGQQLVSTGVANTAEDVNGVLMNGFYHLYGPINDFV